jgi:hypothetical protein
VDETVPNVGNHAAPQLKGMNAGDPIAALEDAAFLGKTLAPKFLIRYAPVLVGIKSVVAQAVRRLLSEVESSNRILDRLLLERNMDNPSGLIIDALCECPWP